MNPSPNSLTADALRALGVENDTETTHPSPAESEEWRPGEHAPNLKPVETSRPAAQALLTEDESQGTPPATTTPSEKAPPNSAEQAWWRAVAEEAERAPELNDRASDLSHGVHRVLREAPFLSTAPEGYRHAVALARAELQAAALPGLQAKIETLVKENQRLERLTSITGSPPARGPAGSGELSEHDLRRLARDLDAGAGE